MRFWIMMMMRLVVMYSRSASKVTQSRPIESSSEAGANTSRAEHLDRQDG